MSEGPDEKHQITNYEDGSWECTCGATNLDELEDYDDTREE